MRTKTSFIIVFIILIMAAGAVFAETPNEQFKQMVEQLQKNPTDNALREKIIKFAQELKPAPALPAEAERFEGRAQFAFKNAKSPADYLDAAKEYEKAVAVAPWVPGYYADLCTIYEKAEKYVEAKKNCEFFLASSPSAQDASDARKRIAGLELAIEKANAPVQYASEFVFVKGGCFRMGRDNSGYADEEPVHEVFLDDYYIGKYEVTQGQWSKVMGNNPSSFKHGDNYPVEQVGWDDIQVFLQKLSQKTGQNYRLPTEAEWEYAARNGGKQEEWAGTSNKSGLEGYAWFDKNSGGQTHPVGQKMPNGLGIYDMSGNVWEWCSDWYDVYYYSKSPRNNPHGPSSGSYRVLRGGSWGNHNEVSSLRRRPG